MLHIWGVATARYRYGVTYNAGKRNAAIIAYFLANIAISGLPVVEGAATTSSELGKRVDGNVKRGDVVR